MKFSDICRLASNINTYVEPLDEATKNSRFMSFSISYNRDSLMIREKTYNINVTYGESGVTGCRERVIDNLRKQCQEKAGAMLGEVAEFDVRDIHFRKEKDLTNAKNNFRGRFCDYDADRASCFIRVQY